MQDGLYGVFFEYTCGQFGVAVIVLLGGEQGRV